ncbi:hypothetical protein MSAN_00129900 [Mycena sanguinolenta]|uniref:DUF6534 domain-containing protein n=1 Tax=Mycena sanguinolenta TaxID=230812 RepID=A0A8H7DIY5_9AGAR|nr:hypothetical protein MSAN_00129900 [Mycena sanguinolenta]
MKYVGCELSRDPCTMSYSRNPLPSGLEIAELSGPVVCTLELISTLVHIMCVDTQLLGYLLNWALFGALTLQLYLYYQAFPNDVLFNKCLVYTLCAIELVQTPLMTYDAFSAFAYGFGDLSALTSLGLEWVALPIMSGLVSLIGQSFYAYRVHVLSKSWWLPAFIIAVALISSVGAFVHGADSHCEHGLRLVSPGNIQICQLWLLGSALSDITSTTCLAYYLSKNNIGFHSTRAWFHRLIRLTIQTGSLTALMALVHLTLFFAFPGKPYFFTAAAVQSKLYANTVLAVLNSRLQIVGGRGYTVPSVGIEITMNEQRSGGGSARSPVLPVHAEVFSVKELDDLANRTI